MLKLVKQSTDTELDPFVLIWSYPAREQHYIRNIYAYAMVYLEPVCVTKALS
jgi:hypothetical protein